MNVIPRIIPTLLLSEEDLVKTKGFKNPVYVGDPANAIKIFNEKEADELVLLDISARKKRGTPNFKYLEELASECFMPVSYGGGISDLDTIRVLLRLGIEKVILNTAIGDKPQFLREAAERFGSSTIIAGIDYRRNFWNKQEVLINGGSKKTGRQPLDWAKECAGLGAGEIFLNDIGREGTFNGYDLELLRQVCREIEIPLTISGGAGTVSHLQEGLQNGASAAAAGSMFVFQGKHRAVMISYPVKSAFFGK